MSKTYLIILQFDIGVIYPGNGKKGRQHDRHITAVFIAQMDKGLYSALNQEEHQTKIAGAHMVLAALERGVGSYWVSRFEVRQVAELLHLPEETMPAEILLFGYPEEARGPTPKKNLDEVVFYNAFGRTRK